MAAAEGTLIENALSALLQTNQVELRRRLDEWTMHQDVVLEQSLARHCRIESMLEQLVADTASAQPRHVGGLSPIPSGGGLGVFAKPLGPSPPIWDPAFDAAAPGPQLGAGFVALSGLPDTKTREGGAASMNIVGLSQRDKTNAAVYADDLLSILPGAVGTVEEAADAEGGIIAGFEDALMFAGKNVQTAAEDALMFAGKNVQDALASAGNRIGLGDGQMVVNSQWRRLINSGNKKRKKTNIRTAEMLTERSRAEARAHQGLLMKIVTSRIYDAVCALLIILNAMTIGWEVQYIATLSQENASLPPALREPTPRIFDILQSIYCAIFALELALRWAAEGKLFFHSSERAWNGFDVVVVGLGLLEQILKMIAGASGTGADFVGNLSALRILRVLRLVRVLRVIRVLRFFRELRMMLYSILSSISSLFWSMWVLTLCFYIFGISMTSGVSDYLNNEGGEPLWHREETAILRKFFGSLDRSMYALYRSMSGGNDWGDVVDLLDPLPSFYQPLFLVFISFAIFAVVNVVTGVFVENAMQSSQQDREVIVQEEVRAKEKYLSSMQELFEEMDSNQSGSITHDEFERQLDDERALAYFDALKLEISDVRTLFTLLDIDQTGAVDVEEFLIGCQKLKGEAKSLDLAVVNHEIKWLISSLSGFADYVEQQFTSLRDQQAVVLNHWTSFGAQFSARSRGESEHVRKFDTSP